MDDGLKQRLIGAIVLLALAVIFLPVLFDRDPIKPVVKTSQIPSQPEIVTINIEVPSAPKNVDLAPSPQDMFVPSVIEPVDLTPEPLGLSSAGTPKSWVLQIASFRDVESANKLREKLLEADYPAYNRTSKLNGAPMTRVFVGPKLDKSSLVSLKNKIDKDFGLESIILAFKPK